MRMCCIKLCAGKTIRVSADVAQLKGSMCLYKRDFKTHNSQIVCLLRGLFNINASMKSTAPAVMQSPCFLSTLWPMCKKQLVTRLTNHQLTLSSMLSHEKRERPRYHASNMRHVWEGRVNIVHPRISASSLTGFAFLPVSQLRAHFAEQLQSLGSFQFTGNSKFFCLFILGRFRIKKKTSNFFFFFNKYSGNCITVF